MRENRPSGSEGGAGEKPLFLPLSLRTRESARQSRSGRGHPSCSDGQSTKAPGANAEVMQVVLGGLLVFGVGLLIGSS
jgi:hypothetical protein